MSDKTRLDAAWAQAEANPGVAIDIGRAVVCDSCGDDYTDSPRTGGFVFLSRGICPGCASDWMSSIIANGEQRYIRAAARDGQTFADFVREYRGPNNCIKVAPLRMRDVE